MLGKLADLKAKRNDMDWDHPDRVQTEKEINGIEQWCIDNHNKYVKKLTTWRKGDKKITKFGYYAYEELVGGYMIPDEGNKVREGIDECGVCHNICIHHVLFDWCVVCDKEAIIVNYHS